ncbi:MAG: hypothetical protein HQ510_12855 [Candidatus Marinimicrobia bacterium]|nr:hypothetical protein [Candidatus Neomarinimicrobiota bacterium]
MKISTFFSFMDNPSPIYYCVLTDTPTLDPITASMVGNSFLLRWETRLIDCFYKQSIILELL